MKSATTLPRLKLALAYLVMLIPSLFAAASVWTLIAPERLYHCWDVAPLVTFIPPFAHRRAVLTPQNFDHYIWTEESVYAIWLGFVVTAIAIPAIPIVLIVRAWKLFEKKDLFTRW